MIDADPPDLSRLRAFAVFADCANLTQAARTLGLSQPALHAQIKQLSARLGVTLYHRVGRRLVLTEAGHSVAAFARDTLDRVARFEDHLRGRSAARPARLCAGEGAFLYLLGPALADFAGPLQCLVRGPAEVVEAVRTAAADLGVVPADAAPAEFEQVPIAEVGVHLIIPDDHRLAIDEGPVTADALAQVALVVPPAGRPLRRAVDAALEGVPWRVAVEVRGWPLALRFAELGVGVAVANAFCPAPIGCVTRPWPAIPHVRYVAIRRPDAPRPPTVAALWSAVAPSRA